MKEICIVTFLLAIFTSSYKKEAGTNCPYEFDSLAMMNVFTYVDNMPEYPGGDPALIKFIAKNFKYPNQEVFQASFQIQFIVDVNGSVLAARIKNRRKNELTLAERELLKVICKMPKWKPGACFNKTVPVKVILPLYL